MLVKGIFTAISGSIGGITGSHNKGGQYLRARTIPTNPQSVAQTQARSFLTAANLGWTMLTQQQRDDWNAYSVEQVWTNGMGDTIQLSGHSAYVGMYTTSKQALPTAAPPTDPPIPNMRPNIPAIPLITESGGAVELTGGATGLVTERNMYAISRPLPAGVTGIQSPVQIVLVSAASTLPAQPITPPWTLKEGDRIVVARKRASVFGENQGAYSTWAKSIVTIVAPAP